MSYAVAADLLGYISQAELTNLTADLGAELDRLLAAKSAELDAAMQSSGQYQTPDADFARDLVCCLTLAVLSARRGGLAASELRVAVWNESRQTLDKITIGMMRVPGVTP